MKKIIFITLSCFFALSVQAEDVSKEQVNANLFKSDKALHAYFHFLKESRDISCFLLEDLTYTYPIESPNTDKGFTASFRCEDSSGLEVAGYLVKGNAFDAQTIYATRIVTK